MSMLQETLESGKFTITAETAPPRGIDFAGALEKAGFLKGRVQAVNVTDFQSASIKATSLAMCKALLDIGLEPVLQLTGRDRNRIAIQGEMLSAGYFGIPNILALTGDYTTIGDNPGAKPVYDLDSVGILQAASTLRQGVDLSGKKINEIPEFFMGASVTPEYEPLELQVIKMRKKIKAGARFFQTQGIFDLKSMAEFRKLTRELDAYILAGIIPLKSAGMARYMNKNVPGIKVPEELIKRMTGAENPAQEGISIAGEIIAELKRNGLCHGVHIMAIGSEENVLPILDAAGL